MGVGLTFLIPPGFCVSFGVIDFLQTERVIDKERYFLVREMGYILEH